MAIFIEIGQARGPEFYTLNVDSAEVWLAVDSTERISIEAQLKDMRHCKVTGSEETRQIQQLKNELDANDAAIINSVDHFVKLPPPLNARREPTASSNMPMD